MSHTLGEVKLTLSKFMGGDLIGDQITATFAFNDYANSDAHMTKCFFDNDKEWYRYNLYKLVDLIIDRL